MRKLFACFFSAFSFLQTLQSRHILQLITVLCFLGFIANAQEKKFVDGLYDYIGNTAIFELNQEEGRTFHIPPRSKLLNGLWKFYFSDVPEGVPLDFFQSDFNDTGWDAIQVPSNWEMQGFGDKKFRNVSLSFPPDPPLVPKEYNPTGAYRTTFAVPYDWKDHQTFLRFEKVASASFIRINGQMVGYNEGAQEPAEYNITEFVKPGENFLSVAVVKFSAGYYLEDQDYWRLAGIFDDVWLFATPKVRLFDWQIITDFDENYIDSELIIHAYMKNYGKTSIEDTRIQATLYDPDNQIVAQFSSGKTAVPASGKSQVDFSSKILQPKKWTAETPDLYHLHLQILSSEGEIIDNANVRMGFKKTEIRGETFFLNGVPIKVNAMNSHMQHPGKGHTMDEQTIRKDFEILKQFNFNSVRTSHYPPVNKYLELADEYGLYIID